MYPLLPDNVLPLTNASLKHSHCKDLRLLRKKYRVDLSNFGNGNKVKNSNSFALAKNDIQNDITKKTQRKLVYSKKKTRRSKTVGYSMTPKAITSERTSNEEDDDDDDDEEDDEVRSKNSQEEP